MNGLGHMIEALSAAQGARPALIHGGRVMTYGELAVLSRRAAGGLGKIGIRRGDRVAFWLPNLPAYVVLLVACARIGAVAVAVNTRFRASEVGDIVGRSGAKAIVLWPDFLGIPFRDILADVDPAALARVQALIVYGEDDGGAGGGPHQPLPLPHARRIAYETLIGAEPVAGDGNGADAFAIFTTSGTTKAPKFVLHRQRSIVDHARDVADGFGYVRPATVLLQALPLCGVFGFCQAMSGLASGAAMHMMPAFDAGQAVDILQRERITQMNGADDMFMRMFAAAKGTRPFPHLRFCGFAAFARTPAEMVAEGEARGVRFVGLYGMSEIQALFARWSEDLPPERRAQGGGVPVSPAASVRVRDPDSGRLLGAGAPGELEVKGPSLMAEYFGDAQATAAAFTDDGYLRTGDLGELVEGGGFLFHTRIGDVLRLGGFLVSPAEIEAHLQTHAAVEVAQVVGVTTSAGPRAIAFVTLKAGAEFDETALQAHCRRAMAAYKVPVRVIPLGDFPTTPSANGPKIQRARLREMAARAMAT